MESGTFEKLRHLTRTTIAVRTQNSLDELSKNPHVHDMKTDNGRVIFSVDSDVIGDVIAEVSRCGIISIECTPPTLEEMFMRHYQ